MPDACGARYPPSSLTGTCRGASSPCLRSCARASRPCAADSRAAFPCRSGHRHPACRASAGSLRRTGDCRRCPTSACEVRPFLLPPVYAPPIPSMTTPVPPHSAQGLPSTTPVPLQARQVFSPVPGVPGGAWSPG
ncbi:hypothetical protein ebA3440 [Aromatoleum aromaticum EbN1]|uniref:Uncharacterized protein n=1 Tax=Aromatoleum aromaticum (strain DSM 19018 / LMG 30748 / EbN1) TaxID=76114 RepID=Q5P3P8_AROAE|nr:hypothetical protein ebA3440 [Aromatoleum aromaticum EbN1]